MREMLEAGLMENLCAPEIFVGWRGYKDASRSHKINPSRAQTFSCTWISNQFFDKKSVMYRPDSENTTFHGRRCN